MREALEGVRSALQDVPPALRGEGGLWERLRTRVERDLLPRLAAEAPALLAAVAGPNNVGKSSLFNTLAGAELSAARAEGGLTKQCLAVAHPSLAEGTGPALLAQRFDVHRVPAGERAPVDRPGPPGRLFWVLDPRMPRGLLWMDTPDFDSVYAQNRTNAEALLLTVDALVFVVSRQTYQNAALVEFLRACVGAGRPYVLVYNEASGAETARAHLAKLEQDVGQAPVARYFALHQPSVETGGPLETEALDASPPLKTLLTDPQSMSSLKTRALQAGLRDTLTELDVLGRALRAEVVEPNRVLARLRHELQRAGERAAQQSVPADVLIAALRDELDARSRFHRWVRLPFRALASALGAVGRGARRALEGPGRPPNRDPRRLAEAAMREGLLRAAEALAPEAAAYRGDTEIRALLSEAVGAAGRARLEAPLAPPPAVQEGDRVALAEFCRQLVREELPGGAEEGALQALATLVYSVPASTAALVTVATGGMGPDTVIWAGTLLTTPLMERFVDLLGSHIREKVQKRWSEAHGSTLAATAERTYFPALADALADRVRSATRAAAGLQVAADALRRAAHV